MDGTEVIVEPSECVVIGNVCGDDDIFRMLDLPLDYASDGGVFDKELLAVSKGDSGEPLNLLHTTSSSILTYTLPFSTLLHM